MPRENSAGAIIYRMENGNPLYLLLHYHSGHWEFVKGHIEESESFKETIKREAKEETGIKDLKIITGFKEYSKYFFKRTYDLSEKEKKAAPWVFKLVAFFVAKTETERIKLSFEHKDYIWLPYEKALKKLTYKNAKEIFKKAHDFVISREGL